MKRIRRYRQDSLFCPRLLHPRLGGNWRCLECHPRGDAVAERVNERREYIDYLRGHLGMTLEEAAADIGIKPLSLRRWLERHP